MVVSERQMNHSLMPRRRDCGKPRPPLATLSASGSKKLAAELDAMAVLRDEPRGW